MDDEELATILGELNRQSVGYLTDEVAADQDDNLDRYLGEPYGDEEDGTSNAMSMDIAEVVDWALPDLLEPFLSGERVIEYEPSTRADEQYCDQAGDLAHFNFYNENDGVTILYDTVKTACIQKIGITKTWWHKEDVDEEQTLAGLTAMGLAELRQEKGVEVLEEQAEPVMAGAVPPEALAAYEDGMSYTVRIKRTKTVGKNCIESVPPEEFKVSQRAKNLKADYLCHEVEKTRAELIAMGFDAGTVMGLAANKGNDQDSRKDRRFSDEQRQESGHSAKASDYVTLCEEYPLLDVDGTGKAKRWQIFRVNKTILGKEQVDDHPFDAWSPDRIPHRLIGLAIADKVKQTQWIKTHLTRQMLDNVYLANNPRFEVPSHAMTEETIDDLLTYRVGGLIRTKGEGGAVRPIEVPDRSATAMQAIMYMDSVREQQSGIVRNGMSISSEVVDPKSATEARKEDRNEQSRKRLMIRMLAETLLVPIFRKILKNMVKYQDAEKSFYVSGKFVEVNPSTWSADMRCTASVGLGYANRDEDMQAASLIGQAQQIGMEAGIVTPRNLYSTATKLIESVGWRFPEKYFTDPESEEGQAIAQQRQQAPDPKMIEVQGKLQLRQMEMQMDAEQSALQAQRDIQLEMLKAEAKQAVEERKADFDFRARMTQIQQEYDLGLRQLMAEMALKRQQMQFEAGMAVQQQKIDAEQSERQIEYKRQESEANTKIKAVRFGGKLG